MNVWAMKCVAYDEDFQRQLVEKSKDWVPNKKDKKEGGGRKSKRTERKRDLPSQEDEYHSRGTRSRPRTDGINEVY